MPGATVEATLMVAAEEPEPGAVTEVGSKVTVMPEGAEAERAMAELKPPETAVVMVDDPLLPTFTESDEGDAEMVKAGVCVVEPVSAAMRPALGLPHPVTRSYPVTAE